MIAKLLVIAGLWLAQETQLPVLPHKPVHHHSHRVAR